jgi:hypothetical protein
MLKIESEFNANQLNDNLLFRMGSKNHLKN